MRTLTTSALLTLTTICSLFAANEPLPNDVKQVMKKHQHALEKLDDIYRESRQKIDTESAESLKKLKIKYEKLRDLDAVIAVNQLLTQLESNSFRNSIIAKKWSWTHKNDSNSWFILNADGNGNFSGVRTFKWAISADRTIKVTFSANETTELKWDHALRKYSAKDFDGKTRVSGKQI